MVLFGIMRACGSLPLYTLLSTLAEPLALQLEQVWRYWPPRQLPAQVSERFAEAPGSPAELLSGWVVYTLPLVLVP